MPVVPRWVAQADVFLAHANRITRVIGATTPLNWTPELARAEDAWREGDALAPCFTYRSEPSRSDLQRDLARLADAVEPNGPLGEVYAARARELATEAAICDAAGSPALLPLARSRFALRDGFDALADALAAAWLAEPALEGPHDDVTVISDDEADPRSLLASLRREVGRRRLPLRVVVHPQMAALAAVGEGALLVAAGRPMSLTDVARTVLHELEGHAIPSVRAAAAPLGVFAFGTARGSDDQEGRALAIERAHGFLVGERRRELALRHAAARSVHNGAEIVDTIRLLLDERAPLPQALRIASRAHRGGGLAREAVYLPALLRVEDARRRDGCVDAVLRAGRVSVDAASVLRPFLPLTGGAENFDPAAS